MRAALGLALAFGGSVLALYVLSGRVPFSTVTTAPAASARVIGSVVDQGVGTGGGPVSGPVSGLSTSNTGGLP